MKRIFGICLLFVIIIILLFFIQKILYYKPNIINEIESPDKKYIAYVYEKNSGMTASFVYRLDVLKKGEKLTIFNDGIYISDTDFNVKWIDDDKLFVDNSFAKKIYYIVYETNGIMLEYKKT